MKVTVNREHFACEVSAKMNFLRSEGDRRKGLAGKRMARRPGNWHSFPLVWERRHGIETEFRGRRHSQSASLTLGTRAEPTVTENAVAGLFEAGPEPITDRA